ncbi:saccharopine dehydrogenase [Leptospira hartskeerlii]|uniref:Saccharopine dehydrogenase n=1 Tax=Leptospira hartskeerlii TaxID=2023177 RepID=A0A2M9XAD8_9LEPT|nr:saccharopine dehydrogenase NADP-binding domain-containing protein [Leptospira hartskeerlii]PJZ24579.1 saccharopine dehydrogenase [Leptospira hartskeerlii]PJZ32808.1 saccharopine dehydrogenase [Leptospira hartskeerlii]
MAVSKWMIYGANGYTGELIARRAVSRGLKPVLAGRSKGKIEELANELRLEYKIFDLNNPNEIGSNIQGFQLVLHCAGPFIQTSVPMAKACISKKVNYLDITGEIPVYESLQALGKEAENAGVLLLPGVGFDIVPTDCLASSLKESLSKPKFLELAFVGLSEVSPGTMKSALAQLPYGSKIRRDGQMVGVPHLSRTREVVAGGKTYKVYGIPWGDVFTAYISTGIPNIDVYTDIPSGQVNALRYFKPIISLLKIPFILKGVQALVGKTIKGPGERTRTLVKTTVWGEVRSEEGKKSTKVLECKEGYEFTVESSLAAVSKVLSGKGGKGFKTPSLAFGSEFVLEIPGSKWKDISN